MADSVEWFVADLARGLTGVLVNRYAIEVAVVDRPGGAAIRCAAELAPDVQTVPTAVGDVAGWEA